MRQIVELTCPNNHKQTITFEGVSPNYVEMWVGLITGISPLYKVPVGPSSSVGKCCSCGAEIKATIKDSDENTDNNNNNGTPKMP